MPRRLLVCLGYGYTAAALARRLPAADWDVLGTRRAPERDGRPPLLAFPSSPGGQASPALIEAVRQAAAILISIPPDDEGCPAFRALAAALAPSAPGPRWLAYLSTSGVYGDLGGGWAFEDTPRNPQSPQAARRCRAEDQWLGAGAHVFRLPGIYGPGRSALDKVRAGLARRIVKPGQVFSRAHVEDIAAALAASLARPHPRRIYHVSDDEPAPPQDVTAFAAALLAAPVPPEIPWSEAMLTPQAARFYAENKRLSNARAKAELGWRPAFPTYREGLTAILRAEQGPAAATPPPS